MPRTTRRKLASTAALLALFGSTGPFTASAVSDPGDELATIEDYAAQKYEAWGPDAGSTLRDRRKFLAVCANAYAALIMAVAVMERDHHGNAAVAAAAPLEDMFDFVRLLQDTAERYDGLAQVFHGAHVRALAGMARHAVATGRRKPC